MAAAVSIIVPIYHGRCYIEPMIKQIKVCSEDIDSEIELLFVNDNPQEPIRMELYSGKIPSQIKIRVLNTYRNRGIHGARVRGLKESKGEFILFLDQDDRIFPLYLKSQMSRIGDADAVVCRLIDGKRIYYDAQRPFEKVADRNYMLGKGNSIVSPGQVLLRRQAVSDVWQQYILQNNGADDWFLWICMLSEGKRFLLNDEILFEHVLEGKNASLQTMKMIQSQREVIGLLKKSGRLSRQDLLMLEQALWEEVYGKMNLFDKHRKMVALYDDWMRVKNTGRDPVDLMKKQGYRTCAIYGSGMIGKQIHEALKGADIIVRYFIDRSLPYIQESIPVYSPGEELPEVDALIISLVEYEEPVREMLSKKMNADIWSISELIRAVQK